MVFRLFTPELANRALPLVRQIVADILKRGSEAREILSRCERRQGQHPESLHAEPQQSGKQLRGAGSAPSPEERDRLEDIQDEIRDLIEELEQIGCYYKDFSFEVGLVDFPGQVDGQPVLLCWRSDEDEVSHYHELAAGYAGRKAIPRVLVDEIEEPLG